MVQFTTVSGGRLSSVESSVAGAGRIAEAVKGSSSTGGGSRERDGADVQRDHQHLVASGRFIAEGKARSAANANATEGSSLLQIADDALAMIGAKLDRLAEIAQAAEQSGLSTVDRAQMDIEFQTVKDEIDTIAADTSFDRLKLLQGGTGAGGEFEISFKVGTGNGAHDSIIVSIAPAAVSDLSAGLATGSVTSMVGASTARSNIAAAGGSLDLIRGRIAGDMERFSIASRNNGIMTREFDETRAMLTTPAVVIDLAQMVARRAVEDGGFDLADRTVDQMRQLLIKLGDADLSAGEATKPNTGKTGTGLGERAPAEPTNQPDTSNKDAA